ncbi:MAG TPA: response regulator [Bdellovibrionota bacterium]|nr:response regulator [Bdellovibrionota bacterium]
MKTKRVLFVDDEACVRDFFQNVFVASLGRALNLDITVCGTLADAKTAFGQKPDVVVCDYMMREHENGLDFFRYVTALDDHKPFIIFTGADDDLVRPIVNEQEVSENLYLAVGKDWELLKQMLITILEDDSSAD